jgi:hypothetical protein
MFIISMLFCVGLLTFLLGMEKEAWSEISTAGLYLDGYFSRVNK